MLNTSCQSLNVRLQTVEQAVNQFNRRLEVFGGDVEYLMSFKTAQNKLVSTLHGAIKKQEDKASVTEKRLATAVERAVEVSWEKLYSLQETADLRQNKWHIEVTKDFKAAHRRIEDQVKTLREKAQASTEATHALIQQEVIKMDALSENMLNRLNILTNEHEAVQAALQDVVARQKDVKRASHRISGRLSGASAVSSAADVDVTSQQSTETPFSAESSRRRHHREQSSSDEASGLDDYVKTVNRKLRKLTSKIYMKDRIQQERDRSSSRETAHVHRRLNHMCSGIHNAQTSADHLQQSVSMLDSDLQDTRQRQIFQELLSSGIIKELVFH